MNIGLIGYGYWGPNLLRNLCVNPKCCVVGACELSAERRSLISARHPDIPVFADQDEFFATPGLEAVVIATPVFSHYPLARAALERGLHVFVEKPMATSTADALDLVETAETKGVTLMVGHTFLYSPPVNKIKSLIDGGDLGEIYFISASRVNLGIHQPDVSVIWDLAPHDFSIIYYWLGESATHVSATGRDFIQKGLHDIAFIDLEFPSGTVAHVQDSWLSPSKRRHMTIVGSEKMVYYDDTNLEEQVRIFDKSVQRVDVPNTFGAHQLTYRTGDITTPRLDAVEPLAAEMDHFIESVMTGRPPRTDGWHGLSIVKALEAADRSINADGAVQAVTPLSSETFDLEIKNMRAEEVGNAA